MGMSIAALQEAIDTLADGLWGPASRGALLMFFANKSAPAISVAEMEAFAGRLGCSLRQMAAVATVESSGSAFDRDGRPKILFERHLFHRITQGRWSPTIYSLDKSGGYEIDSWTKLAAAAGKDPDAAFASCSWGKFQVLGMHWSALGYASPFELAASCRAGEVAHYELLARFIEHNKLTDELRALSTRADDCRAFARAYNGPEYEKFSYHIKLAAALR